LKNRFKNFIIISAIIVMLTSIGQWAACRFYVLPTVWPWYAKWIGTPQGKMIDPTPMGCNETDSRTITVLLSVLATLISLSNTIE
jgi:hypothetical protein